MAMTPDNPTWEQHETAGDVESDPYTVMDEVYGEGWVEVLRLAMKGKVNHDDRYGANSSIT